MRLTIEKLGGYSTDLDGLADEAERQVTARLAQRWQQVSGLDPKESVPLMREEAATALVNAENTFGVSSAALGHNMLSDFADTEPPHGLDGLEVADEYADTQSARYWAKFIDGTDEGFERFLAGVVGRARKNVSHAADREVALGAAKMGIKTKGIRFARVPSGPSCGFCIMLASRGFVYATREAAGEFTKFHDGCDCRVIAGMQGMSVEGYDPKGLYDRYAKCRQAVNGGHMSPVWKDADGTLVDGPIQREWDAMTDEERAGWGKKAKGGKDGFNAYFEHRVCQEMDTRDREWVWSGRPAPIKYEKPREALEQHERAGVDHLSNNGIAVTVKDEIGGAAANIDFEIHGEPVELKNVTSASSASNQVKRARIKWWKLGIHTPMQVVFTTEGTSIGFLQTVTEIEKRLRAGEEAIIVSNDGLQLRRIKK